jgi:hypothetical protein
MSVKKIILFAISLSFLQQCSNPTGPPIDGIKDPRNYSWTIDTLFYPTSIQTNMRSILGSAANNVYAVGHSDEVRGSVWRFDGNSWKNFDYLTSGVNYDFGEVYGFSANDIWMAGTRYDDNPSPPPNFLDSSFIVHFNGSWQSIKPAGGSALQSVWGNSPTNVWFGGAYGTLFQWNGSSVKQDSLPIYISKNWDADPFYNLISISGNSNGAVYFLVSAYSPQAQTHMYLFMKKQNNWSVVDSSIYGYTRNKVWVSEEGNIYETGEVGFFKWNGSGWDNILGTDIFNGVTTFGIEALSESNMFIVGWSYPSGGKLTGLVYHYNGKDFYSYENLKLDNAQYLDAWSDGKEVFIVGQTFGLPSKTIILHGK